MKYNDKDVLSLSVWNWSRLQQAGEGYERALWRHSSRGQAFLGTVDKKYLEKRVTTIPEDSTLYFDKSSEFPRMKLQNTKFKRCVKLDKADYIVVSKDIGCSDYTRKGSLFEWRGKYILVEDYAKSELSRYGNPDQVVLKAFPDSKKVYDGTITDYTLKGQYPILYTTGEYTKPFIYDDDLNKIVDKSFDGITDEDLITVAGMLKSPDNDTVNLGLQMLAGFNVSSCPGLVTFILQSYPRWTQCYKSTVLTDNLLNTLKINRYPVSPKLLLTEVINKSTPEEYSRLLKFIDGVLKDNLNAWINNFISGVKDELKPKIELNVEWPDRN